MTNQLAIFLGIVILGSIAYDAVYHDWEYSLFLARKGVDFLDYIAFWR